MKLILIFFSLLGPILRASEIIGWETDFDRVMIIYLDQDKFVLEEDKNNCILNNFGSHSACTLITIDKLNLISQSDQFSLYDFLNAKPIRLVRRPGFSKILKTDEQTRAVVLSLRLHPKYISTSDFIRLAKYNNLGRQYENINYRWHRFYWNTSC